MMHSEHKLVGGILIGLMLVICVLVGIFLVRPMFEGTPPAKFKMLPVILASCLLPLGVVFYYLNNFMSDGHTSIKKALTPILSVYVVFMVGWISAYISRRRGSDT